MGDTVEYNNDRSRRDFLSRLLGVWSVITTIPIAAMVIQYLTPPDSKEAIRESMRAASINDIPVDTAKIVKFNKDPVIIVHTKTGQFRAFSARCTHLGCIVQYKEGNNAHFACNCHGSEFSISGKNIAGPAPSPLTPYKVTLQEASIVVSRV